VLMPVLLN